MAKRKKSLQDIIDVFINTIRRMGLTLKGAQMLLTGRWVDVVDVDDEFSSFATFRQDTSRIGPT